MKSKRIIALTLCLALAGSAAMNTKVTAGTITDAIKIYASSYKEIPTKYNVAKNKSFEVKFNKEINSGTVNSNSIKVVDSNGNEAAVKLSLKASDKKVVILEAPAGGYKEGETYAVIVRKGIGSLASLGLLNETVMKFTIAVGTTSGGSTGGSTGGTTVERDSIDAIIKTLAGNRYLAPQNYTARDWRNLHDNIVIDDNNYNISVYYDYVNSIKTFKEKYANNPVYADITNLDYYKNLPNLTINFDNVNNSNEYSRGSGVTTVYYSKTPQEMPKSPGVRIGTYYRPSMGLYSIQMNLLEDKTGFGTFIWRPDFEKAMLDEINTKRKEKGLNSLTLNNDLIAMAKHSAKLSQLGFSHNSGFTDALLYGSGRSRLWARGTVPFAYDNTQYVESLDPFAAVEVKLENNANKMFGYTKPIKVISEATCVWSNPKQIIDAWENNDKENYEYYSIHSSEFRVTYRPKTMTKEQFDTPVNLNENIFNPNMKTIGIGCTYEPPIYKDDMYGNLGVFIIVSN